MPKALRLPRRSFLRGVLGGGAISIGLPALDCMFDGHGEALADGPPIPKRFGVWYWGGGVDHRNFAPAPAASGWMPRGSDPNGQLAPLADPALRDRVTVVTNVNWGSYGGTVVHGSHRCIVLSCSWAFGVPELYAAADRTAGATRPSVDQVVADAFKAGGVATDLPYLNLRISNANGLKNTTSFRGRTRYSSLPMQANPQVAWDSLFKNRALVGGGGAAGAGRGPDPKSLARKYVVDAAREDAAALAKRVGKADRDRLQKHLDGLSSLERRIAGLAAAPAAGAPVAPAAGRCRAPERSKDVTGTNPILRPETNQDGEVGHSEKLKPIHDLMAEILYYAIACDLTRVFSLEFTSTQTSAVFSECGVNEAHHIGLTHRGQTDKIGRTVRFSMEQLALLLKLFANADEGAGKMLDHMCVYATSESSNAGAHAYDAPMILAGRAGGALRGGQAIDGRGVLASRILLSACRAVGAIVPTFGDQGGRTESPFTDILKA